MMSIKKLLTIGSIAVACSALNLGFSGQAVGATFPTKPIRLIVPSPGATEVICRALAERMSTTLGQSVVVETKPGAGTTIASTYVVNAPADGHTLLCGISALLTAPQYFPEVKYDPMKDFAPVALVVKVAHVMLMRADLPFNNVRELIAYARANPNKLTFGSSGIGTSNYLGAALFQDMAKVEMMNVPYQGGGPALQDLVGGRIDVLFDVPQGGVPFVENGRLRALGVTTSDRLKAFPDWPTISEAGVPGYASFPWAGVLAPAKTPPEVVDRLNAVIGEALETPELRTLYERLGLEIGGGTPRDFHDFMEQELTKWIPIIDRLKKESL